MNKETLGTYLTDHIGGAAAGHDLAEMIRSEAEGTPLGAEMAVLATEIAEDRETLQRYIHTLGVGGNPLKEAAGTVAEKAARVKLDPRAPGGSSELKRLMALETLGLGIAGKVGMWRALDTVMARGVELPPLDTAGLIARGTSQLDRVERWRRETAVRVLA